MRLLGLLSIINAAEVQYPIWSCLICLVRSLAEVIEPYFDPILGGLFFSSVKICAEFSSADEI